MPAPNPSPTDEDHRERYLRHDCGEDEADSPAHDRQSEQPASGELARDARAERHARAEPDEDRAEHHTVGSVAAAQARGEDLPARSPRRLR